MSQYRVNKTVVIDGVEKYFGDIVEIDESFASELGDAVSLHDGAGLQGEKHSSESSTTGVQAPAPVITTQEAPAKSADVTSEKPWAGNHVVSANKAKKLR